jgi:hypothetical protein
MGICFHQVGLWGGGGGGLVKGEIRGKKPKLRNAKNMYEE